jgi:predicted TIM-barrel fold metal-dependent hydrolase
MVIDVDGHVFEPASIWARYLPAQYHDRMPRIVKDRRGTDRYELYGRLFPTPEGPGQWQPEGVTEAMCKRPGGMDPQARLRDMDDEGIDVAVLYGTMALGFAQFPDPDFGLAVIRAYHDWLFDYCQADPRRLKGVAALPLLQIPAALDEGRRCVNDLGFVAFMVGSHVSGQSADHPSYAPLYGLAEELEVPLGIHIASNLCGVERFTDQYALSHVIGGPFEGMLNTTAILGNGVLERHRKLRIAVLESGCGWLPSLLDRMDEHFEHRPDEFRCTVKPSEMARCGRFYVGVESEEQELPAAVRAIGSENLLWASDYPHWDSIFPGSVRKLRERTDVEPAVKQAILDDNPRRFFGWS